MWIPVTSQYTAGEKVPQQKHEECTVQVINKHSNRPIHTHYIGYPLQAGKSSSGTVNDYCHSYNNEQHIQGIDEVMLTMTTWAGWITIATQQQLTIK